MDAKARYHKLIEEIKKKVVRDGKPITNEQIADDLHYTREHFQRLYTGNGVVKPKHITDLLYRFPETREHNITDAQLQEEDARYDQAKKQKPPTNPVYNTRKVDDLIESTRMLSDSNLINARNIDRLITMLEANSTDSRGISLATDPSFSKLIDLLWQIAKGTGKWEENQFRAMVASVIVPGDQVHDDRDT